MATAATRPRAVSRPQTTSRLQGAACQWAPPQRDKPDNQHSYAHFQQPLSSEQQCGMANPLRADSAASQDSCSGDVASNNAPMQGDAGRLVSNKPHLHGVDSQ
jgi:hypothetical protein